VKVVRDPLWNTIPLDATAIALIDAPEFQRLRHIRQLGLAYLVYPGANHSRFDHAIGVHHLVERTLRALEDSGQLRGVPEEERRLVAYAGLLHDIGHYPFSHTLEELESGSIPGLHEELSGRFLAAPAIREPPSPRSPPTLPRASRRSSGGARNPRCRASSPVASTSTRSST